MSDRTKNETTGRLLAAVSFASRAHRHQLRKDGRTPYASHPVRVCLIIQTVFGYSDPDLLTTAILHDTIEDTTTDYDDLEEEFGPEIAGWVSLLSKDKRLPETKREENYLASLSRAPRFVKICKLADIYDNLLDSESLSAESRAKAIARSSEVLTALSQDLSEELLPTYMMVAELLEACRAKSSKVS